MPVIPRPTFELVARAAATSALLPAFTLATPTAAAPGDD